MNKLVLLSVAFLSLLFTACEKKSMDFLNDDMSNSNTTFALLTDESTGKEITIQMNGGRVVKPEWLAKEQQDFAYGSERDANFVFVGAIEYKGVSYLELYNLFVNNLSEASRLFTFDGKRISNELKMEIFTSPEGEVKIIPIYFDGNPSEWYNLHNQQK